MEDRLIAGQRTHLIGLGYSLDMKQWLAPLAAILVGVGAAACGSGTATSHSGAPATRYEHVDSKEAATDRVATGSYLHNDGDDDSDDDEQRLTGGNDDQSLFPTYGSGASHADTSKIKLLVRAYFTAIASDDGTTACRLLDPTLVAGLAEGGGQGGHNSDMTCAQSMSSLFNQQRKRISAAAVATMTVVAVYVKGSLGMAVLGFKTLPEQALVVEQSTHVWKVDATLGSDLT